MKNKLIKSSAVSITESNSGKLSTLKSFIENYRFAVILYVDYLFDNKITFKDKKEVEQEFDIKSDQLNCPKFYPESNLNFETDLSARVLKCASNQALSIVKSAVSQRKKYLYIFSQQKKNKKRTRSITKKLLNTKVIKPNLTNVYPELNSICCNYHEADLKTFDNVIVLSSLGKKYGKIILPIKHTKHSRKLESKGKLLSSFLITNEKVHLRYDLEKVELKSTGIIVGADQGINTCITLSDNQVTKSCIHNHTLNSIIKKIARKRKGSKAFHKAKDHQVNYINWSIKQLNLSKVKEIRLEKINNFRHKKNVGKFLNHFNEKLIRSKLIDFAQSQGVLVIEQSSAYRSQRCSYCGYVSRRNRKGKNFSCKHCSFQADADYNASCNHEVNLPSANFLLQLSNKPKEFFWKEEGFYDLRGQELTVPDTQKDII